jgi:hypothetical protein
MRRSTTNFLLLTAQAGTIALLAACQPIAIDKNARASSSSPGTSSSANPASYQQLIVKFKATTFDCNAADIARLAVETNLRLDLVRPMSGNACVIRQLGSRSDDFNYGLKLLRQHPAIEWVELDGVMKTK